MTPRQILAEVIRDYRYNVKMGMPVDQSLEVLKAMIVDLIEFEKDKMFEVGQEAGAYAVLHDLWLGMDPKEVLEKWSKRRDKAENTA